MHENEPQRTRRGAAEATHGFSGETANYLLRRELLRPSNTSGFLVRLCAAGGRRARADHTNIRLRRERVAEGGEGDVAAVRVCAVFQVDRASRRKETNPATEPKGARARVRFSLCLTTALQPTSYDVRVAAHPLVGASRWPHAARGRFTLKRQSLRDE